jgi:hypothetical protein
VNFAFVPGPNGGVALLELRCVGGLIVTPGLQRHKTRSLRYVA